MTFTRRGSHIAIPRDEFALHECYEILCGMCTGIWTSAVGHSWALQLEFVISAFRPRADMRQRSKAVGIVPGADNTLKAKRLRSARDKVPFGNTGAFRTQGTGLRPGHAAGTQRFAGRTS